MTDLPDRNQIQDMQNFVYLKRYNGWNLYIRKNIGKTANGLAIKAPHNKSPQMLRYCMTAGTGQCEIYESNDVQRMIFFYGCLKGYIDRELFDLLNSGALPWEK